MTREQYLNYRNSNSIDPLYHYYMERCKTNCLAPHDFIKAISMWPAGNSVFQEVLHEYDVKYEVISVQDSKTGQILKYL